MAEGRGGGRHEVRARVHASFGRFRGNRTCRVAMPLLTNITGGFSRNENQTEFNCLPTLADDRQQSPTTANMPPPPSRRGTGHGAVGALPRPERESGRPRRSPLAMKWLLLDDYRPCGSRCAGRRRARRRGRLVLDDDPCGHPCGRRHRGCPCSSRAGVLLRSSIRCGRPRGRHRRRGRR